MIPSMKKVLLILLVLVVVTIAAIFIFIPNDREVTKIARIEANQNTIYRALTEPEKLNDLLKSQSKHTSSGRSIYQYHDLSFQFQERMNNLVEVTIGQRGLSSKSIISIHSLAIDSSVIEWRMPLELSNNPLKRIQQYFQARVIKENMTSFLQALDTFVVRKENIYGVDIKRTKLNDSLLITTKVTNTSAPTPELYYGLIKEIQAYAEAQGATVTNYPMLNITPIGNNHFETMVALPLNKEIPSKGALVFKRMHPGNILTTEVKGGQRSINEALVQLSQYMSDYNLVAPAIPFQSLVTDRIANRDSSQWVSKLNYPIF